MNQVSLPADAAIEVEVRSLLQKPSNAISLDDLLTLHRECKTLAQLPDVAGIVITHGTDTLEETAFFLDMTLPASPTVVVTGSQRAPHEPGTDAFRNIADAVLVAASDKARGLGTLVVFNQSIFAARQVRKVSSFMVNGFGAPETGPLGYIDGARVNISMHPSRHAEAELAVPDDARLPRVDILPAYLGASPDLLNAATKGGAVGLVIDGLGRGHVPPDWMDEIAHITARGIPVVIVSSCPTGPVNTSYEFVGSLANLKAAGVMAVLDLSARKARLALSLVIAAKTEYSEIPKTMRTLTA